VVMQLSRVAGRLGRRQKQLPTGLPKPRPSPVTWSRGRHRLAHEAFPLVLVIDDDRDIRVAYAGILSQEGRRGGRGG
jgi:hypothetical protein